MLYYRLKQIDNDGSTTYSPVRAVQVAAGQSTISVFPNPAADALTLDLTSLAASPQQILIHDLQGREIIHCTVPGGQQQQIAIASLPSGLYYIAVRNENGSLYTRFCKE